MIRHEFDDIYTRIGWYTQQATDRDKLLAYARELERIAAEIQAAADEIRRLA